MDKKNNIIPLISKLDSKYVAYGDDSQVESSLAYAFVIAERDKVEIIEKRILELKDKFRIPHDTFLHCRVLFHPHAREKAKISHLSTRDAHWLIEKAITIINRNDVLLRYAVADMSFFYDIFTPSFEMTSALDGSSVPFSAKPNPKGILAILMNACCVDIADHFKAPKASDCEVIAAEDKTSIEFIGKDRKRADRHYEFFSAIGAPPGMVYQHKPNLSTILKEPLLQLADIAAYICSHAHRNSLKDTFFKEQLARVKKYVSHNLDK